MKFDSIKAGLRVWHLGLLFLALYFVLFAVFTHKWAESASIPMVGDPIRKAYDFNQVSSSWPEPASCQSRGVNVQVFHELFTNMDGSEAAEGLRVAFESEDFVVARYSQTSDQPEMIYFAAGSDFRITNIWRGDAKDVPTPCDLLVKHLQTEGKL